MNRPQLVELLWFERIDGEYLAVNPLKVEWVVDATTTGGELVTAIWFESGKEIYVLGASEDIRDKLVYGN